MTIRDELKLLGPEAVRVEIAPRESWGHDVVFWWLEGALEFVGGMGSGAFSPPQRPDP